MFNSDESSIQELIAQIPPERRIDLIGPMHPEAVTAIVTELSTIQFRAHNADEPILLYISTEGGHYRQGVRLYEALRLSRMPVVGLAVGQAHSTGLLVLQGCRLRVATEHARFLVHHPFVAFKANVSVRRSLHDWKAEIERIYKEAEKNTQEVLDIITSRDKSISREQLRRHMDASEVLNAESALAAHLIDHIIST
jgi:ATP-dependent Clp protease protease subunit